MKKWNRYIFYLIGATLLFAVAVQSYWNYKNYKQNSRQVNREIRRSFNDAIREYYAMETKKHTFSAVGENLAVITTKLKQEGLYNSFPSEIKTIKIKKEQKKATVSSVTEVMVFNGEIPDSLKIRKDLTSIIFSMIDKKINYLQIDSLFNAQLVAREIPLTYGLQHWKEKKLVYESNEDFLPNVSELRANSTFLKPHERLVLRYNSPTTEILLRSLWGILFSVFLVLSIFWSLWYLLYIIRQQKQISEMKNDLISNITHEFKTPISTASAAIEAMLNFKILEDKSKTENYLKVSENQLKKLYLMVEKLLEMASLDSSVIALEKEVIDLVEFLEKQVAKFTVLTTKNITFQTEYTDCFVAVDAFHLENVVGNLIDNAIKYGGDAICVSLHKQKDTISIEIIDNGGGILPQHQKHIFDKFYRIPKGNRHDVKGFGIGLYYAQKIVQKHGGSLALLPNCKETIFKIILPNE